MDDDGGDDHDEEEFWDDHDAWDFYGEAVNGVVTVDQPMTTLVLAIVNEEPLEVIQGILRELPELMRVQVDGVYPMSYALWHGFPFEHVRALYDAWPDSLRAQDDMEGWVPLHNLNRESPVDITEFLIDMYPGALRRRSAHGDLPIHTNVNGSLASIRVLVQRDPESLLVANNRGYLPIHAAAKHGARSEVIAHLAEQSPVSLLVATAEGHLPVHVALQSESGDGVIHRLAVEAIPEETRLGLMHFTVRYAVGITRPEQNRVISLYLLDNVRALAAAIPETFRAPDSEGMLPIHVAVRHSSRPDLSDGSTLVRRLVELDPASVLIPNRAGDLPVHVALGLEGEDVDMTRFLIEHEHGPDSLRVAGAGGGLPLHVAVSLANPSPELVHLMVDTWRGALDVRDASGRLPLSLALANSTAGTDVIYCLVRAQPSVLRNGAFLNAF